MGGLGVLLRSCPNAKTVAPASFTETLIQPKQVISATRAIYGDHFSENFEPVRPVEKEVIKEVVNGDIIDLGERSLQFIIPTNQSFMLTYDESRNHLYIGHALGVYYDQLQDDEVDLFLPCVPASLFDLDTYKESLKSIEQLNLDALFFNHFGKTEKVDLALKQLNHWIELFIQITKETIQAKGNFNDLSGKFLTVVHNYLKEQNIPDNHQIYQYIILDINTAALTMLSYFKR